ncbi:MAG: alpha/beta hydrolase, partial [Moraxellaceae bacterium]
YGSNVMQVGELRLPQTTDEKPLPLVIIIHGGCWVTAYADYHFMDKFADAVTNLGYATWNIEYRAIGTGGNWPIIFQDISNAIDYTSKLAQSYPIDSGKVAIIGHSAGGHLALWTAGRSSVKNDNEIYTENPLKISGVISLAGIANVTANTGCNTLANDVIGMSISSPSNNLTTRLQITSPLQMLPTKTKTVVISGGADRIVPATIGTEYSKKATELGDNSVHYILPGLDHFDLIDPDKTNWSLYQKSLQDIFKD